MSISRRVFFGSAAVIGTGAMAGAGARRSRGGTFPYQSPEDVRSVVGASHANLERVRELVTAAPELAKSSWDWGFGDWESALGAASHTGRREIALFLMEHGARPNLFTHAMLGHLDVVKATIDAMPGVQRVAGPHGISLLRHARSGGEPALETVAYLEGLGDADPEPGLPISEAQKDEIIGAYETPDGVTFTIERWREGLSLTPTEGPKRGLSRVGDAVFHPAGAPSATLTFSIENGRATTVVFAGSAAGVRARRVG